MKWNNDKILVLEYCFCIFTFLTIPAIHSIYPQSGILRYLWIVYFISAVLVTIKILILRLKFFSSFILLVLLFLIPAVLNFVLSTKLQLNVEYTVSVYTHVVRYFFLALTFLYYPGLLFVVSKTTGIQWKPFFKGFVAINAVIIPVFQILFAGSSLSSSGILLTHLQEDLQLTYNNYLVVSDAMLFSSLLSLTVRRDFLSLVIHVLVTIMLILNGSRVPALIGVTIIFVHGLLLLVNAINHLLRRNSSIRFILSYKKLLLFFLFCLFAALFSFNFLIFFIDKTIAILNLENVYSSRVYSSLVNAGADDASYKERLYIFECFYNNHLWQINKFLFGGPTNLGCSISYLHSTLSVFVNVGLIGFLPFLLIIAMSIRSVLTRMKSSRSELVFHLVMVCSFLFLGFSSRAGVSLVLPALAFAYSSSMISEPKMR
jgi:hypothetical protein